MGPACVQTDAQLLAARTDPRPGHPTLQGHKREGQHTIPPPTTHPIIQLQFNFPACCGQKKQHGLYLQIMISVISSPTCSRWGASIVESSLFKREEEQTLFNVMEYKGPISAYEQKARICCSKPFLL